MLTCASYTVYLSSHGPVGADVEVETELIIECDVDMVVKLLSIFLAVSKN